MNGNNFDHWLKDTARQTLVMGIVNATPDSFSDGGEFTQTLDAIAHARVLIAQGADLLDIGGESTRPGAQRISAAEQIARVIPVIEMIRRDFDIALSIDTTLAVVAQSARAAGANIVNDVSAGREDPNMLPLVAAERLPLILMHMLGAPATMQDDPVYAHVTREVGEFLAQRAGIAMAAGVAREKIVLDPGIGFGKTAQHNLQLLRELGQLTAMGFPLLIGTSRKRFVGAVTEVAEARERVIGSCVSAAWAVAAGARIVRAHDVAQTRQAVRMIEAILQPRHAVQNG